MSFLSTTSRTSVSTSSFDSQQWIAQVQKEKETLFQYLEKAVQTVQQELKQSPLSPNELKEIVQAIRVYNKSELVGTPVPIQDQENRIDTFAKGTLKLLKDLKQGKLEKGVKDSITTLDHYCWELAYIQQPAVVKSGFCQNLFESKLQKLEKAIQICGTLFDEILTFSKKEKLQEVLRTFYTSEGPDIRVLSIGCYGT